MKKLLSILKTLLLILSIVIVIFCVYIAIRTKQTGKDVYILGYKPYIISTGSMEPTLKVNGLIVIKQVPYEDIKVNDIINFTPETVKKNVCHRVIEITPNGFVTKGDNNFTNDMGMVTKEEYNGKLVFSSNAFANLYYSVTEGNRVAVIGLIILLIICSIVVLKTVRYLKRTSSKE